MEEKELLQAIKQIIAPLESDINNMRADMKEMRGDIKEMRTDITEMQADMKEMRTDINILKTDMHDVKNRLGNVEHEVVRTNLMIENEIMPAVQAIREGQRGDRENFKILRERTDEIEQDVIVLKVLAKKKKKII